jgi:SAM-dependent methyltransferase
MCELVSTYSWPSQAFWRYFELKQLRGLRVDRPILEIGCGDGKFSSLVFPEIDEGIDLNAHSVARARTGHLYKRLRCADARNLEPGCRGFATVYANCVMEHIPDLPKVLRGCYQALCAGGHLIITVPLLEMNHHLAFSFPAYARMRQRQLAHYNLLSAGEWRSRLGEAGFGAVEFTPYLGSRACRFWDEVDVIGCLGAGRYCLATLFRLLTQVLLPQAAKRALCWSLAKWLQANISRNDDLSYPCAVLISATK